MLAQCKIMSTRSSSHVFQVPRQLGRVPGPPPLDCVAYVTISSYSLERIYLQANMNMCSWFERDSISLDALPHSPGHSTPLPPHSPLAGSPARHSRGSSRRSAPRSTWPPLGPGSWRWRRWPRPRRGGRRPRRGGARRRPEAPQTQPGSLKFWLWGLSLCLSRRPWILKFGFVFFFGVLVPSPLNLGNNFSHLGAFFRAFGI